MAATKAEIDSFHRFALDRLAKGPDVPELDELMAEWYDAQDRDAVDEIIRKGIAEIEAGVGRDAFEFTRELMKKHGIPCQDILGPDELGIP